MRVDVVILPVLLNPANLAGKTAVVFDVLRATSGIAAAMAVGVASIRIFSDIQSAVAAAQADTPAKAGDRPLLAGEVSALRPPGFDLGNSPRQYDASHRGRRVFLATTNGTKAIVAASGAATVLAAALVNAGPTARFCRTLGADVTLLCSGTEGQFSLEDFLGAGAVLAALRQTGAVTIGNDAAITAAAFFTARRDQLRATLASGQGGHNVVAAGLEPDIDFAARLDALEVVCRVEQGLIIRRA